MKDITGASVVTSGNLAMDDAVECSIDASGMGHIMSILSNMYSNKSLAVLREYSANAWDAHIEAGTTHLPIEVALPSVLQPTLIIKDFGTGLSRDEIINVFGSYGTSTKRNTNDQVGALGIGSKAAFTLGQQFVVTGIKDGLKSVVLFALNEKNVGTMKVVHDSVPTQEPNGVMISLAVEDVESMQREAAVFFSKWKPGRVLVDGEQPESIFDSAQKINDVTHVISEHSGSVWVVMGQIAYAVDQSLVRKVRDTFEDASTEHAVANDLASWYQKSAIFFDVEIGDVDIAPSRESLRDTARTVRTLARLFRDLATTLNESVQTAVDAQPNAFQGVLTLEALREEMQPLKVHRSSITYLGQPLPEVAKTDLRFIGLQKKTQSYRCKTKVTFAEKDYETNVANAKRTVVVVVNNLDAEFGAVRRYAKRFLEQPLFNPGDDGYESWNDDPEMKVNRIVVTDQAKGQHDWFVWGVDQGVTTLSLEEYRVAVKGIRDSSPKNRNTPSYSIGWGTPSKSVDERETIEEILEYGADIVLAGSTNWLSDVVREALADYTVVTLLPQQSAEQFRKRIAAASDEIRVLTTEEQKAVVNAHAESAYNPTDAEKEALGALVWLSNNYHERRQWESLAETYTKEDREIPPLVQSHLDTIELAKITAEGITQTRKYALQDAANYLSKESSEYVIPFEVDGWQERSSVFPLLEKLGGLYWQSDAFKDDYFAYLASKMA